MSEWIGMLLLLLRLLLMKLLDEGLGEVMRLRSGC
jgi:hypothetical protein